MKDIVIERLRDEVKMLKKRYTNWSNVWFPKKKKKVVNENYDVWYKIMVTVYDK